MTNSNSKLYTAYQSKAESFDLQKDKELCKDVQERLLHFKLLTFNGVDGIIGNRTRKAISDFNKLSKISGSEFTWKTAEALIEKEYKNWFPGIVLDSSLSSELVCLYEYLGFRYSTIPDTVNICSIQGINRNKSLNADTPFVYNDRIVAFGFKVTGEIIELGNWLGTAEPGRYYWNNPLHSKGCATIKTDTLFRNSHSVGIHRDYRALVQSRVLEVLRGRNKTPDSGLFGINIHSVGKGKDFSFNDDIGLYSAGCTVLASREEFDNEFMSMVYQDSRYRANKAFAWDYVSFEGKTLRSIFPFP